MNSTNINTNLFNKQKFVFIFNAAMEAKSYRFAREAALNWLQAFPGDLGVRLMLARTYTAEGDRAMALPILVKLTNLDPEFIEAQEALSILTFRDGDKRAEDALGSANALGKKVKANIALPVWAPALRLAFIAFQDKNYGEAEKQVQIVIGQNPDLALAAVLHLKITCTKQDKDSNFQLASIYHSRWPDCLQFSLCLADAEMEQGQESEAVSLLHQCVANDAAAQAPKRLWGTSFRYRPLWPDKLEIPLEIPIPSPVAAVLGWNKLPQGDLVPTVDGVEIVEEDSKEEGDIPAPSMPLLLGAGLPELAAPVEQGSVLESNIPVEQAVTPGDMAPQVDEMPEADIPADSKEGTPILPASTENVTPAPSSPATTTSSPAAQTTQPAAGDSLRSVAEAFANIAERFNQPDIARADGRFPVYLILSTRTGLTKQYGQQSMAVIDDELKKFADTISLRGGMRGLVFYPDDPEITNTLGVTRVDGVDPWKIKLAINDLDKILGKKGEMIGALVIIGGPEVVPFHQLPNPTDDADAQVASDNPYAALDSNYFIPEWPIGRVPGETGQDAGLLLEQIRKIRIYHGQYTQKSPAWVQILSKIWNTFQKLVGGKLSLNTGDVQNASPSSSIGFTASVWKRSSLAVFRSIGDPNDLLISPPEVSGNFNPERISSSQLGYFNLHGVTDGPNWYGQRDTADTSTTTDYPVALSPKDLLKSTNGTQVVYSEACYGGLIFKKSEEESIALKFLSMGVKAFVGSTGIAYGSVNTPLIGGDLLGFNFWKALRQGYTAGEALMQAKIELVREMNKRQGFLDGEDQKTLISFVLYGDPLSGTLEKQQKVKKIFRMPAQPEVKTFSDAKANEAPRKVGNAELYEIKQIVASYLPGLEEASICIRKQRVVQAADSNLAMAHLLSRDIGCEASKQVVVTIEKRVETPSYTHHHYAKATLDPQGKLIKLALSR